MPPKLSLKKYMLKGERPGWCALGHFSQQVGRCGHGCPAFIPEISETLS